MKIVASYEKKKFALEFAATATVTDILKKVGANPEMVLVSINGKFVPDTEAIKAGDKVEVHKVVSGG